MKTVHPQELQCPFPSRVNPIMEAHCMADSLMSMTARLYPTAPEERLSLMHDIVTLTLNMPRLAARQLERQRCPLNRQHLQQLFNTCLTVMQEPESRPAEEPGLPADLQEVWLRLQSVSSQAWRLHFIQSFEQLFKAMLWEHDNLQQDRLPSLAEFWKLRQYLGGAHILTDLITVAEAIDLPQQVLLHPSVMELTVLARNIVCWGHDLLSFHRAPAQASLHNLVTIVQHERRLPLQSAIYQTIQMHNNEMFRFTRRAGELPSFGPYDAALRGYVHGLSALLKGNIDWHAADSRQAPAMAG